jgi:hypothetical protein
MNDAEQAYNDLISSVSESGLAEEEAKHAVRRCVLAMAKGGFVGYTAMGALAYFMSMNPATALPYLLVSTSGGAAYQLAKSPQCEDVRKAVFFWNSAKF